MQLKYYRILAILLILAKLYNAKTTRSAVCSKNRNGAPQCGSNPLNSIMHLYLEKGDDRTLLCGAVLLSSNYAISNNACVKNLNLDFLAAYIFHRPGVIKIEKLILQNGPQSYNLALLKLMQHVEIAKDNWAEPMCLPTIGNMGSTFRNQKLSSVEFEKDLNINEITITGQSECQHVQHDSSNICGIRPNKVCSKYGGIIYNQLDRHDGKRYTLIGFYEKESNCNANDPYVIVDVSAYLTWIRNNMR